MQAVEIVFIYCPSSAAQSYRLEIADSDVIGMSRLGFQFLRRFSFILAQGCYVPLGMAMLLV